MPRHPTAARVRRPRTEPDDVVVATVFEWSEWARRNARLVIIVLAVAVVAVLAFLYLHSRSIAREALAATRLAEVRQTVASGNLPLATKDLQEFIGTFGKTRAGIEGRLLLAQVQLQQGQPDGAAEVLRDFSSDDALLNASRLLLLGGAYEQAGDTAKAIDSYLAVGNSDAFEFQRREGLENAARLQMQTGRPAEAARLYGRLADMVADEPSQQSIYRMRQAEALAVAGQASGAAAGSAPKD